MKKLISALLVAIMFIMNVHAEDIKLEFDIGASTAQLNNTTIQVETYLSDQGNTMVGLRAIVETLGVVVEWIEETRTVKLSDDGLDMEVVIDLDVAMLNGQPVKMTEAATIRNDRTMVPIRFISEGFGANVVYHADTHSVTIQANSREERYRVLEDSLEDMASNYPTALQGWLMSTDDTAEFSDFRIVWDSVVNTKIMELLPGRYVTEEISNKYRSEANLEFNNVFKISGATGNDINTPIMFEISGGHEPGYECFVYNPVDRTILIDTALSKLMPTQRPMFDSESPSGGGSSSSGSSGGGSGGSSGGGNSDYEGEPESTVEPSLVPTGEPTAIPTIMPTVIPTMKPTAVPTLTPTMKPTAVPTMVPTMKPTAVPTAKPTMLPTDEPCATPSATYEPSATELPSSTNAPESPVATEMPTMHPTMEPEGTYPTEEPTAEPTIVPTELPEATLEPTPEPTPQITEGPEGDDNHFDDIINGEESAQFLEFGIGRDILWVRHNYYMPMRSRLIIKFLR